MTVVERYFAAFNAADTHAMLDCLAEDVVHCVNQGDTRHGKEAFAQFCGHMAECYKEQLYDLVTFVNESETRAAAEFTVHGAYLKTDGDLPHAKGQTYKLPAGSFFELENGLIKRVTTYYNLTDWLAQVGA